MMVASEPDAIQAVMAVSAEAARVGRHGCRPPGSGGWGDENRNLRRGNLPAESKIGDSEIPVPV